MVKKRRKTLKMLEKIFGKKSTGVVYIICAAFFLLALAGAIVTFILTYPNSSLYSLLVQGLVTAVALISISAPVFVQKRFRYYIPPFIEIALCIYVLLLFFLTRFHVNTVVLNSFLPATGGFIFSMTVFAVIHSALSKRAQQKDRTASPLLTSACTLAAAFVMMLALAALFSLAAYLADTPQSSRQLFMIQSAHFILGSLLFCVTGYFSVRSHSERFRIHSFKNIERGKRIATEKRNKTMFSVVENLSKDQTDYKKVFQSAKARYYLIRIVYLAAYAGYIIHACIVFSRLGNLGYAIIFFHCSSFLFTSLVYVYEYILYRRKIVNQRLRKLKIAKTIARSYTLILILAAMYVADYNYNKLSAFISVGMLLFNLCLLFYNLFGKPKYYPSAKNLKAQQLSLRAKDAYEPSDAEREQTEADSAPVADTDTGNTIVPDTDADHAPEPDHAAAADEHAAKT